MLGRLEKLLHDYFNSDTLAVKGLPTVQFITHELHVSPNYLSRQSTQQLIHDKVIAKAKEMLSTTHLSVSEISYGLGFGHPQSFTKLFKSKTQLSPTRFRASFH